MIVPRLIERKRDGDNLTSAEWRELIHAYSAGDVPDYQLSALLMAVFFRGMTRAETDALTDAMLSSGARLDLSDMTLPRLDKHSTGGVGDKVSLILAPLIAELGVAVPMMSGRGLGHTGGTLDKLESIPGFRTDLSLAAAREQLDRIGCALIGQTGEIAPADKKLYALRDATGTVEAIPLISASIMSKKLAEGLTGLVLDVKSGSGAFLPELDREIELAKTMIELGADRGCPVVALVTAMDQPLGIACGNSIEVRESIEFLHGHPPPDLATVTYALGAEMLLLAGIATTRDDAHARMREAIASGRAAERFRAIIAAQGGDPRVVDDVSLLPASPVKIEYRAARDGIVQRVEPRAIGHGVVALGGGRRAMHDVVDPSVGFDIFVKRNVTVAAGDVIAIIHAADDAGSAAGRDVLDTAISIGDAPVNALPLVSHRITSTGVEVLR
ncbi:MAG TPA: thymidine phosphorylase [Gemmatimonadaceae bacterium]|nr:thymidine phosphorylase [Gemmatimonadaceae bacterium]